MNKVLKYFSILGVLLLTACSGGGSGSTTPTTPVIPPSTNFSLPTKISPVATTTTPATGKVGLQSKLFALRSALTNPGTDYSKAEKVTYVDEHALDQFNIIGQVLNALAQTHYNDDAVSGKGAYRAMVAFQDEEAGIKRKTLQPWTVDSSIVEDDGTTPRHRLVKAWIEEEGGLIEMDFKIFSPAVKNTDGSYKNFGTWKMNVKLDALGTANFVAEATLGTNGESVIKIHETFNDGGIFRHVRAVLHKTDTGGFGQLFYPSWDICLTPNCPPTTPIVKYVYDANYIAVQVDNQAIQFKERNNPTEIVHRYGLYDSSTGADILKEKDFGFPVTYPDTNGLVHHAYYGAWQGRHEIWSDAGTVPIGTKVTRSDLLPGATPVIYKVAAPIKGALTKRTKSLIDKNDLKGSPLETWTNEQFLYIYNGTAWVDCVDPKLTVSPPTCDFTSPTLNDGDLLHLEMFPNDYRIFVDISQSTGATSTQYVYLSTGPDGPAFYRLIPDANGNLVPEITKYGPSPNDQLWININGSIFIEVDSDPNSGTGWIKKTVTSFDQRNHRPIFAAPGANPGDKPWRPIRNREYYINNNGSNFIFKRSVPPVIGEIDEIWVETQTVANPINSSLTAGMTFAPQFNEFDLTNPSSYKFDTVPGSLTFLQLVYETIGEEDKSLGVKKGDLVTQSLWGLGAYSGNPFLLVAGELPVPEGQFNWEYPRDGETWGTLTYLQLDDPTMNYVTLSDPIRMNSVSLPTKGGETRLLSLQYDGWMHGLPDLFDDLQRNNFVLDPLLSNKIINIPEIQILRDKTTGRGYRVKQLEVSQFLNVATDPVTLDISLAAGIDLSDLPPFVAPDLVPMPEVTGVKYSEGILVQ